nr:hypothetical protein [Alcaligenes sp. HPC1271]
MLVNKCGYEPGPGQRNHFPFCIFEHHSGITTFALPAETLTILAPQGLNTIKKPRKW